MSEEEVLSEGELEALMDTFSSDDLPVDDGSGSERFQPFDFSTREQTLVAQMPGLKQLCDKHALALGEEIQSLYGIPVQVQAADTQLLRMGQAMSIVPSPSGINVVKTAPLNGESIVVFPGEMLSFLVDKYFGGAGAIGAEQAARADLTPTETRINEVLTARFLATLVVAWQDKLKLTPKLQYFESKPSLVACGPPDELAFHFSFALKVDDWSSAIDWIVPYASLEPLRLKLGSAAHVVKPGQKSTDWENHFNRELQLVELEVRGTMASGSVSLAEVLSLKAGSIVPLKMPIEVAVSIEDRVFSYGEHGVLNGNKSIKIKEVVRHDKDAV